MSTLSLHKLKRKNPKRPKVTKKPNRFDGLNEEEVQKNTLPDYLDSNLDIIFIGINPGLMSAHRRRYYAGPGNHFYKLLHSSNLVPKFINYDEDYKLLEHKIGLTNIVSRATKSSSDLTKAEIKEGAVEVRQKLANLKPKVAVFNGKCIYEVFVDACGRKEFRFGLQPKKIGDTAIWVVPSSSARCSSFPRMSDKLHFYVALKKYMQFVNGEISNVEIGEFVFEKSQQIKPQSTSVYFRKSRKAAENQENKIQEKSVDKLKSEDKNLKIPEKKDGQIDFVSLIKQRVAEKRCNENLENKVKKLKEV